LTGSGGGRSSRLTGDHQPASGGGGVMSLKDMSSSVSEAGSRTGRLTSSYYALVTWLALLTAAILAVTLAVTVCRRRRLARRRRSSGGGQAVSGGQSVVSLSTSGDMDTSSTVDLTSVSAASQQRRGDVAPTVCDDHSAS